MIVFLRKLIAWIIAVAILGQGFGLSQSAYAIQINYNNSKMLGENNRYVSLVTEAVNKDSLVKSLAFSDTDEFYKKLTTTVKSGEPVHIMTDYTSYNDFPPRLKQIFKPDADTIPLKFDNEMLFIPVSTAVGAGAGLGVAAAGVAPAEIDYKSLFVPISTAFGAGLGAAIGLPVGGIGTLPATLIGAGVGLATGTVTVAMMSNKHEVWIEIDPKTGKLSIVAIPVS